MYSTIEDLKKYMPERTLIELTDDAQTGEVDEEIANDVIEQADSLIDTYMRGRYPADMGSSEVPEFIQNLSTKIAAYNLFRRALSTTVPDPVSVEYKNSIQMLKDIQSGKITPFESANEPTVLRTNKTSSSKIYNSTTWGNYYTV